MEAWEIWIRSTWLNWAVLENRTWLWPILESLHFVGLSLLIGTVGVYDLRVLGVAKGLPLAPLHQLIRFGIAGFAINLLTGTLFFFGFPDQYYYNEAFRLKLVFMALAGLNMALFYTAAFSGVRTLGPNETAPTRARAFAAISLGSWLLVLICGRLITFYRPLFMHH